MDCQTTYHEAGEKYVCSGSAAGLHFTRDVLEQEKIDLVIEWSFYSCYNLRLQRVFFVAF